MTVRITRQLLGLQVLTRSLNKLPYYYSIKKSVVFVTRNYSDEQGSKYSELEKSSIANVVNYWCEQFKNEGVNEPGLSIRYLVAHVLGSTKLSSLKNLHDTKFSPEQLEKLDLLCKCRLSRMPLQYIVGDWDFRDLTLKLEPPIFIPRSETEILVENVLQKINTSKKENCKVLDIGCGSGAICLSLLKSNKSINVTAIDINSHACELTIRNAKESQLEDRLTILNAKITEDGNIDVIKNYNQNQSIKLNEETFDFIVSNPPYIPTKTVFKLQPEVRLYEDIKALDGGDDGLELIKPIIKYASKVLCPNGILALEVDSSHPKLIESLIKETYADKLKVQEIQKDFANIDRFVEIVKTE